ncbi:MAG: hypothetical protein IRY91_03585 [Gemmatimonadaceae bacterium]|nr:hypothetical protein [Gemmatimonadaceae bacterium]
MWRARADQLRLVAADAQARSFELAAEELEHLLRTIADEVLTLAEAALRSGYSVDHLARLIRLGKLPNAGRRGAPRIRAADLPRRIDVVARARTGYDPDADARSLRLGSRPGEFANGDSSAETL